MGDERTRNLLQSCANNLLSAINQLENRDEGTNASVNAEPEEQPGTSSQSVVSEHR